MMNKQQFDANYNIAERLLNDFGSWGAFAKAIGIRSQSLYKWDRVPEWAAYKLQVIFAGKYSALELMRYRFNAKEATTAKEYKN